MNKHKKIESKETNIKLEVSAGFIALLFSLIFIFSNHIGDLYQIYFVLVVFVVHQITQAIIFNNWSLNTKYKSKKIGLRILIIIVVIFIAFSMLGKINSHYSYYLGFTNDKPRNTFLSIVIYCLVYLTIYSFGLKRISTTNTPNN